ncbi:MAG: FAD-binding oxidoreductase [Candidatus Muiribacteriota bacterium]
MKKFIKVKVNENIKLDNYHFILKIILPEKITINPGEFFMVRSWLNEPVLNRPLSVYDYDKSLSTLEFFIRIKGKGTKMMSCLKPEEELDLLGPLGNGFEQCENFLAVGAGMGIAPINYAAKYYNLDVIYGINNIQALFGFDKKGFEICSLDGSCGAKGNALEETIKRWNPEKYSGIIACGPDIFLEKITEFIRDNKISAQLSYEERMGCGTGFCMSCTREINGQQIQLCTKGPVVKIEGSGLRNSHSKNLI